MLESQYDKLILLAFSFTLSTLHSKQPSSKLTT